MACGVIFLLLRVFYLPLIKKIQTFEKTFVYAIVYDKLISLFIQGKIPCICRVLGMQCHDT